MDLGEAVQTAVERGLPLLLSTEAAGHLKDTVRVGRMKGRPGMLTITTADGVSATTRRVVAEQAIAELRALKRAGARVTLDAGARQVVRMTRARPLADDPVLLGRQQRDRGAEGRRLRRRRQPGRHRQDRHDRPRARAPRRDHRRASARCVVAEGRLLGAVARRAHRAARPGAGCRRWRPTSRCSSLVRARLDRRADPRVRPRARRAAAASCSPPTALLDRHPADLQTIPWHLLVADEALRYVNPATDAHRALAQVRFGAAADCWLLTATPRGKSAEHLDVLVGLAVGDEAMIRERLNTREAGNLIDEINAHRLRVNYGPHLVRVTRQDMAAWMPDVRPAEPLAIEPDARAGRAARRDPPAAAARPTGGCSSVLRELKTLEHGSDALPRRARRALARAGDRALATSTCSSTPPSTPRR